VSSSVLRTMMAAKKLLLHVDTDMRKRIEQHQEQGRTDDGKHHGGLDPFRAVATTILLRHGYDPF